MRSNCRRRSMKLELLKMNIGWSSFKCVLVSLKELMEVKLPQMVSAMGSGKIEAANAGVCFKWNK